MKDQGKIKNEFMEELTRFHHRVSELDALQSEHKKVEGILRASEKYRAIFKTTGCATIIIEEDSTIFLANKEFKQLSGFSKEEVEGKKSWTEFVAKEDLERIKEYHCRQRVAPDKAPKSCEFRFIDRKGSLRDVFLNISMIPGTNKTVASFLDVTDRKRAETRIRKLYSLQQVIRKTNQVLLKIKDEPQLFQRICDLLVHVKNFKVAWVGLLQKKTFTIKPVARAGLKKGYLSTPRVTWDDSKYGRSPTGMAIKRREPFIMRDIQNDSRYAPWRKEALERGYASSIALPLLHGDKVVGALTIYSGEKDVFGNGKVEFLKEVAENIHLGIKMMRLEKKLEENLKNMREYLGGIIRAMELAVEKKDPYTAGHQQRVSDLARSIATQMGLPKEKVEGIRIAASIHDIGKITIPAEVLTKPGRLSENEFAMIRNHVEVACEIVKEVNFPWPITNIIFQHHERLDGSGYPQGLKDHDIILEARILAVADTVEAMCSHRPYRPALGTDKALKEIEENKSILYDSEVVDVCIRLFKEKGFKFK